MTTDKKSAVERLREFENASANGDYAAVRRARIEVFHETVALCNSGGTYVPDESGNFAAGRRVDVSATAAMMRGSVLYRDPPAIASPRKFGAGTEISVENTDSFLAGKALSERGFSPAVLNMANRRTPGGGVLDGSGAQEECLFRRSNLFKSLYQFAADGRGHDFGVEPRDERYPLDRDSGTVYSPRVCVFRGLESDGYPLLREPYFLDVVSAAALNRPPLASPTRLRADMADATERKIRSVLRTAAAHGNDALVLGAWGCGAFRNPPGHIASLFREVFAEPEFRGAFRKIVFAIVDDHNAHLAHNPRGNLAEFEDVFSAA